MTAPGAATGARTKVLLVGMMGAGKTSVGESLAARLGWPYLDNDAVLERTAGSSAADLVATQGEEAVRAAERRVLTLLLGMPGPLIAGIPAGVVLDEADRARLRDSEALVVWLRASPRVLAKRVAAGPPRPWLGEGDPEAALRQLAAARNPCFEQVADLVVDVDLLTVGMVSKEVLAAL